MKLIGNTSEMLQHFEKMVDTWSSLLNIRKTSVHQAQRQGISSNQVNGTEGRHHPAFVEGW
jgi:hypothetical protein